MSDSPYLLDSSVLIALGASSHAHHSVVVGWMVRDRPSFATCPITQGALLRISMKAGGLSYREAQILLGSIVQDPNHTFVPDSVPYDQVSGAGVLGHGQVTDAYLVELARSTEMKLATLDRAQAALHPGVAVLVF